MTLLSYNDCLIRDRCCSDYNFHYASMCLHRYWIKETCLHVRIMILLENKKYISQEWSNVGNIGSRPNLYELAQNRTLTIHLHLIIKYMHGMSITSVYIIKMEYNITLFEISQSLFHAQRELQNRRVIFYHLLLRFTPASHTYIHNSSISTKSLQALSLSLLFFLLIFIF